MRSKVLCLLRSASTAAPALGAGPGLSLGLGLGLVVALAPAAAPAECQHDIAVASSRAAALRDTPGKAALLEQIQRADFARHEGDDGECREQLALATDVLDRIDAARRKAASKP